MTKIEPTVSRTPLSHIPKEVATRCLITSPRITNKSRKRFIAARGAKIDVELQDAKSVQEKYCAKLRGLKLVQLGNQLEQARKQIGRFERLLEKADANSKEFPQLQKGYTLQLYRHGWVEQELQRRAELRATIQAAKAAKVPPFKPLFENNVQATLVKELRAQGIDPFAPMPEGWEN